MRKERTHAKVSKRTKSIRQRELTARRVGIFLVFLTVPATVGLGEIFRFEHEGGDRYRIVSTVEEMVLFNGALRNRTEILNRVAVDVVKVEEGRAELKAKYQISEKSQGKKLYRWAHEEEVSFTRDTLGRYAGMKPDAALPSLRHLPRFPEEALFPGDRWSAPAEEVHDLLPFFKINRRIHLPFRAFYEYKGKTEDGFASITINYHLLHREPAPSSLPGKLLTEKQAPPTPRKIVGKLEIHLLWNLEAGRPQRVDETFSYKYHMTNGHMWEFRGQSRGELIHSEAINKEELAGTIREEIEQSGVEGVGVASTEEGVVLTFENIHFWPDSPRMLPGEEEKLEKIGRILEEHSEQDLLVTGHTARVGEEEKATLLSEERARAVAKLLVEQGVRRPSEIVVKGMGSRQPIGDNRTKKGKALNRRVEITLLEN